MFRMQRYMCSRFFIDYKTEPEQRHVITQYVTTHFIPLSITNTEQSAQRRNNQQYSKSSTEQNHVTNARLCLLFFDHLSNVIQQSTVCLTHHDKHATLMTINDLKEFYHYNYKHLFLDNNNNHHHHQQRYHMYSHPHYNHHYHYSSSSSNSSRSVWKVLRYLVSNIERKILQERYLKGDVFFVYIEM